MPPKFDPNEIKIGTLKKSANIQVQSLDGFFFHTGLDSNEALCASRLWFCGVHTDKSYPNCVWVSFYTGVCRNYISIFSRHVYSVCEQVSKPAS